MYVFKLRFSNTQGVNLVQVGGRGRFSILKGEYICVEKWARLIFWKYILDYAEKKYNWETEIQTWLATRTPRHVM